MSRRFTGWHMAAIMIAFFAVVLGVNVLMATLASRTFGGTVVDNSYVASQKFNQWLAEARAQDALGWRARIARNDRGRLLVELAAPDGPLSGARVTGAAHHPLGRAPDLELTFAPTGEGAYLSAETMPDGRWTVRIAAVRSGEEARFVRDLAP